VVETNPLNYFSTTPDEVHVTVALGQDYQVDFGDAVNTSGFASILGTVFDDLDGDGLWDATETGLQGVTVTLDGGPTALTNQYGQYSFKVTVAGAHKVIETNLPGYLSTTPDNVQLEVALNASHQVDFGDALDTSGFASIHGTVFDDMDGSGVQDLGEPGLPGVTVMLDGGPTAALTNQYGQYSFKVTNPSVHRVVETNPLNYFSTTPDIVHVNVVMGMGYVVDFGDAANTSDFAAIYGTVFDDQDGDTIWDLGELGLAGVDIALDSGAPIKTDDYGSYHFKVNTPGDHAVVETDLPDYVSTTPNNVQVLVALGNGYPVDFGDRYLCTCAGDACEEDDSPATATTLLPGLANKQTHNFCDDTVDWYIFQAGVSDVYTITTSAVGQRADTYLALYDQDGQTLLLGNDDLSGTTDFSSRLIWKAPADGSYYLRVSNRTGQSGCNTNYEVWMEIIDNTLIYVPLVLREPTAPTDTGDATLAPEQVELPVVAPVEMPGQALIDSPFLRPEGVIQHICPDTYEVDDQWENAAAILDGASQLHSFDSNPAVYTPDKDIVYIDIFIGDTVTFTVSALVNTAPMMELFDGLGASLNITGTTQLAWTATDSGRYYLSISPTTDSYGCTDVNSYQLELQSYLLKRVFAPLIMR